MTPYSLVGISDFSVVSFVSILRRSRFLQTLATLSTLILCHNQEISLFEPKFPRVLTAGMWHRAVWYRFSDVSVVCMSPYSDPTRSLKNYSLCTRLQGVKPKQTDITLFTAKEELTSFKTLCWQYNMDDSGPTRIKRTPAPVIWKLLGLSKPSRIDKDINALLTTLLKFIVSPYTSIWQSLFQIGNEVLNSVVGYPNPAHAITDPFIINHGSIGSRPILSSYPSYNYYDPYAGAISYGLKLLQTLYL